MGADIRRRRERKIAELKKFNRFSYPYKNSDRYKEKNFFSIKILLSIVLLVIVYLTFHSNNPYAKISQQYIIEALTKDYNFQGIYNIYSEKFSGNPAIIPTIKIIDKEQNKQNFSSPLRSSLPLGLKSDNNGILIDTKQNEEIVSIEKGLVVQVGANKQYGNVVVIRHPEGYESTYALLESVELNNNDWIEKGQKIGYVKEQLFFMIKKDNKYLSPLEVVSFD